LISSKPARQRQWPLLPLTMFPLALPGIPSVSLGIHGNAYLVILLEHFVSSVISQPYCGGILWREFYAQYFYVGIHVNIPPRTAPPVAGPRRQDVMETTIHAYIHIHT